MRRELGTQELVKAAYLARYASDEAVRSDWRVAAD